MDKVYHYQATIQWTGNNGTGTADYHNYERSHTIKMDSKPDILGSSDPELRGDKTKHNPEELLVASLSACHMMWYLRLCAEAGINVISYEDNATGIMTQISNGGGRFSEVTLNPIVTVTEQGMIDQANELHKKANELCFIANSVNFPIKHRATAKFDSVKN
ncbi:MAG: OsmC family protein [Ginsengibacter sp.]